MVDNVIVLRIPVVKKRVSKASSKSSIGRIYLSKRWVERDVAIMDWRDYEQLRNIFQNLFELKNIVEALFNCKAVGKGMFNIVSRTWNPVTGCSHLCRYCWARRLAETRLKRSPRYRDGFIPKIHEQEFKATFKPGEFVFVSDMGDLFCEQVEDEWILRVLDHIRKFPKTHFLLLTKNPRRYRDFLDRFPPNVILGATIETNRDDLYREHRISGAPLPSLRYKAMRDLKWSKKFVSVEPVLDFDLDVFAQWIEEIEPLIVYVGYDNYGNRLPEPPLRKTLALIERLSKLPCLVIRKTIRPAWFEGLSRYMGGELEERPGLA